MPALVALAAVDAEIDGPDAGLAALAAITEPAVRVFQPYWATRANLLARLEHHEDAASAYDQAIELTTDTGMRGYLAACRAKLRS